MASAKKNSKPKSAATKRTSTKRATPKIAQKHTAKAKRLTPATPPPGMTRTLTQLEANPGSPELVAQARADIEKHGLQAFFDAAAKTPGSKQAKKAEAMEKELAATVAVPVEKGLLFPPCGDEPQLRQTWKDCVAARIVQPLAIFRPTTLGELRSILRQASAQGCRVKAVGSGHSFADVASTTDFLIETHGLKNVLDLERGVLKPGIDTRNLFAAEGGMRVRDLNEALWEAGFGLINMGGYDGQTIMGVVSTSTHGSGIEFPPLAQFVTSLTTVVANGRTVRIEPHDGITDPARWAARHPDIELVQDDDWFNAAQVGIGCMGVVYAVILRVQPRYWMIEQRSVTTWRELKPQLQDGAPLRDNRHWEMLVNPYEVNGEHTCLITRRNPVDEPTTPSHELPQRNFIVELLAKARFSGAVLLSVINHFPDLVPQITDQALHTLARDYVDRSYRVFNIGAANDVPAYGSEIGFPMSTYIAATDRILEIAGHAQRVGKAYLTSPFSLRFCKSSPAFMSMMFEADTCMIEFPMLANTVGGYELLRKIENEMYAFGGRPHWGLLNFISGGRELIRQMYPQFDKWDAVRQQLDPDGMFANSFTDRAGITPTMFQR
jgi:FAD/FMN-containing dehydrogenase